MTKPVKKFWWMTRIVATKRKRDKPNPTNAQDERRLIVR